MYKTSKSDMGRRAWNILRLALLWTRKGGVFAFKKKLIQLQLHLSHSNKGLGSLQDGDRQLSFDATPMIHVRMHRPNSMRFHLPHIPCINPQADAFDGYDFDDQSDMDYSYHQSRRSFLITNGEEQEQEQEQAQDDEEICEEEGIDVKAEEFIANFYQQLKLQRQISYLECKQN